jgi:hypothetical protein
MDNARKLADKIIADHKVKKLDKRVKEKIGEIIRSFEGAFKSER